MSTWNGSDKSATITLTGGSLIATATSSFNLGVRNTLYRSTGKFYAEFSNLNWDSGCGVGLADATYTLGSSTGSDVVMVVTGGGINSNGSALASGLTDPAGAGHTVDIAVDLDAKLFWGRVDNGNWNGSGTANPATGAGGIDLTWGGWSWTQLTPYTQLHISTGSGGTYNDSTTANFGGSAFAHTKPVGFSGWDGAGGGGGSSSSNWWFWL